MGLCRCLGRSGTSESTQNVKVALLKETPLAMRFSDEELEELAECFEPVIYTVGSKVPMNQWIVVNSGCIQVCSTSGAVIRTVKDGQFLGEENLRQSEQLATLGIATAIQPVSALIASVGLVELLLDRYNDMRPRLISVLGKRMESYLSSIPYFHGADPTQLAHLSDLLTYVPLKKGNVLFKEGDIGRSLFLVYEGCVSALTYNTETNTKKEMGRFSQGEFFGEIGLMMEIPRTATVVANEDSLLLQLQKRDLIQFFTLAPEIKPAFDADLKIKIAEQFRKYDVPFFRSIPDDRYSELATLCTIQEYEEGEIIFEEGEIGNGFYMIAHGYAQVIITLEGVKSPIIDMGPGKFFGEIALVRDSPRTATVKTLSRCVLLTITKDNFEVFFNLVPEALTDFQVKLARYDVSLKVILNHKLGLAYLHRYLKLEHSIENLEFCEAVEEYHSLPDLEFQGEAIRIAEQYLRPETSKHEINIRGDTKRAILQSIDSGTADVGIFNAAASEVLKMIENDSFRRFKDSTLFQEFLEAGKGYTLVGDES